MIDSISREWSVVKFQLTECQTFLAPSNYVPLIQTLISNIVITSTLNDRMNR